MFTGIISELGMVTDVAGGAELTRFTIRAPKTRVDLAIGDSISINGACHTAVELLPDGFVVESVPETLRRTNLGELAYDSFVNLERPAVVGGRLDGHIVTGHVDATVEVTAVESEGESQRWSFRLPAKLARLVVEKGSVTLDGVSLTVADIQDEILTVALIPHTISVTTFRDRAVGDWVNFEADILAKHVERLTCR